MFISTFFFSFFALVAFVVLVQCLHFHGFPFLHSVRALLIHSSCCEFVLLQGFVRRECYMKMSVHAFLSNLDVKVFYLKGKAVKLNFSTAASKQWNLSTDLSIKLNRVWVHSRFRDQSIVSITENVAFSLLFCTQNIHLRIVTPVQMSSNSSER